MVFGTLMAAIFVGQQFMQNVLGYSPLASSAAMIPAALAMLVAAPISARLIISRGSRVTLVAGYLFCALGLVAALGGAIMQSLLGAILAAGNAASFGASTTASPQADQVSSAVETQLLKFYASAADIAALCPQYSDEIIAAAKSSFLEGANLAYAVGHRHHHLGRRPGLVLLPPEEPRTRAPRPVRG